MKELRKPILHLNLKKKWFDMILSGEKTVEYREIKPTFDRIFGVADKVKIAGELYEVSDIIVCFSNGMKPIEKLRRFYIKCKYVDKNIGLTSWGAELNTKYYCIGLGEIIKKQNC